MADMGPYRAAADDRALEYRRKPLCQSPRCHVCRRYWRYTNPPVICPLCGSRLTPAPATRGASVMIMPAIDGDDG